MNGVVVVDKPGGMTSHDVVNRLRRIYGTRRVGHAGTLDPLATGVLVVCLGQATRILEYLAATTKKYRAGILFGVRSDSQDITGIELTREDSSLLRREDVEAALPTFRGMIRQTPPMHSALHHEGKRLYDLARQGIEVERASREVEIFSLEMVEFESGSNAHAVVDVECSSGTYIRTLAADIGDAVGSGAVMDSLRRTGVGAFSIDQAVTLERLARLKEEGGLDSTVRTIADGLQDWPRITLSDAESVAIRQGRRLPLHDENPGRCLLLDSGGTVVALAKIDEQSISPFKVLHLDD